MRSYSETEVFSTCDLSTLEVATKMVKALPDPAAGAEPWRCHEVARAIAKALPRHGIHVVDGKHGAVQHTWLAYRGPAGRLRILDVYAIGTLPQVLLLDASNWGVKHSYAPGHLPRLDIDLDIVSLLADHAHHVRLSLED